MTKIIYLAGGCFWGTEKYLSLIPGVMSTQVGYANGCTEHPTYEEVCRQNTGHAETVRVEYDPDRLPLERLLDLYYESVDPVSVNRQGGDSGTQYRTGVYLPDEEDIEAVHASLRRLGERIGRTPAIECGVLENFWPAEEYHQKYLEKNPGGYCHIPPWKFDFAARGGGPV